MKLPPLKLHKFHFKLRLRQAFTTKLLFHPLPFLWCLILRWPCGLGGIIVQLLTPVVQIYAQYHSAMHNGKRKKGGGGGNEKKDLTHVYKFLVYPASFVGKRLTSTKVNIFLEQVSIKIFVKLLTGISSLCSCYLGLFNQGCLNSSDQKNNNSLLHEKTERSAHKAAKCTLVCKQNTAAPEKKRKITLWLSKVNLVLNVHRNHEAY